MNEEQQTNMTFKMGMTQLKVITKSWRNKGLDPIPAHRGHLKSSLVTMAAAIFEANGGVEETMSMLKCLLEEELPAVKEVLARVSEKIEH